MARKRRQFEVFSMSFLDCMSCGFGAVILFFMIINSQVRTTTDLDTRALMAETNKLEIEVLNEELETTRALAEVAQKTSETQMTSLLGSEDQLQQQQSQLEALQQDNRALRAEVQSLKQDDDAIEATAGGEAALLGFGRREDGKSLCVR